MKWLRTGIFCMGLILVPVASGAGEASSSGAATELERLAIDVVRAEDARQIRKLQRAYGYYADRGLWNELADLFADDAVANYPSGGFDGNASIRAMFIQNLGQGRQGLADGRLYNHIILQPVVDVAPDGVTATGRWRVLGMLGRFGASAIWADSLYRFDYVKRDGEWKIKALTAYAGSGGSYDSGWVAPRPRPPGAPDTSPVRNNLAHPADRPWIDPCEQDVSACVVPFPYANRGRMQPAASVSAAVSSMADLVGRAQRLEDEQTIMNLQRAYGYYLDRGMWREAADLFAPDGTREVGQAGVYVGRERIRRSMAHAVPQGLRPGQLNEHLQLELIVDVAPDGRTAHGRIFELGFIGGGGEPARIVQNIAENEYVRRGRKWMIQSMHVYTILETAYDQGWARSALPAPGPSGELPADRSPTVKYEAYPKVFTPPFHFDSVSARVTATGDGSASTTPGRQIMAARRQVQRVADYNEIENLQGAYGYYAEKSLWTEMADLFGDGGILEIDGSQYRGRGSILAALKASGPEGPVPGRLDSQLQLQPVIHVADDGRSAKIRSRLLRFTRDAQGRPMWGGGIYENELVKEGGTWKFSRLRFQPTWLVDYKEGWTSSQPRTGTTMPSAAVPPFHYRHPVTGR
jgi:hypothetical protein